MLMVLAMLVSLFSGIVSASAASAWSFKSSKYDVEVGETIEMEKNEYADFDLFKNDAAPEGYTVKWSSSDSDAVWVNAKTGQLRADKFKTADYGDKATISATFTNTATGKSATRSFVIVVAEAADYEIAVNFGDEVLAVGQKYDLKAVVKADGKEVEAKVEFAIDGKAIDAAYTPAAAGEFTIVTTATIDGKVVAEVKTAVVVVEAGLESAKQIAYNAVALTFGSADAAKAVAADASKVSAVWLAGENEINAFVKAAKVDEKNAKVVNVELYNNITKDTTYKFTYADKSASIVGVDLTKYASIRIATTSVPACDTETKIKVNFYNAEGILVDVKDTGFTLSPNSGADYYVNGTNVYFYDQYSPKTATLTATYFMGYDENGNRLADLTDTATITSYDATATTASNINGWAVGNIGDAYNAVNYGGNTANLAVVGGAKQLFFKFTVTDIDGNPTDFYSQNPLNKYGNHGGYEYTTTNKGVVLVDATTGVIYPVAAGAAQIVVKSIASWDPNLKTVIGVFNVNVVDRNLLTSIAPTVNKTKLAAQYESAKDVWTDTNDTVWIKPVAKDQFGARITPKYNIELVYADDDVTVQIKTKNAVYVDGVETEPAVWETLTVDDVSVGKEYVTTGADDGDNKAPYFEIKATSARSDYAKNVTIAITATQDYPWKQITRTVNVAVKDAGAVSYYSLDGLTTSFDLNIPGRPDWAAGSGYYSTDIKLNAYDAAGYFIKNVAMSKSYEDAKAGNGFYYTVFKGNENLTKTALTDNNKFNAIACNGDAISTGMSSMVKLEKGTGTYVVTAYEVNTTTNAGRQIAQKSIVVTDSSTPITVIQKDNKIAKSSIGAATGAALDTIVIAELNKDLAFKRDGKDISLEVVGVDCTPTADGTTIYVTNIVVRETFWGFQVTWAGHEKGAANDTKLYGVGKVFEVEANK